MADLKRVAESLANHLYDLQARAIAHLIQPVMLELAGKVREASATGMPMSNDDVQAFVEARLAALIKEEEELNFSRFEQMRLQAGADTMGSSKSQRPEPPPQQNEQSQQDSPNTANADPQAKAAEAKRQADKALANAPSKQPDPKK